MQRAPIQKFRQVGLLRGLLYVGAQCGGAVAGSAVLRILLPEGAYTYTYVSYHVTCH